MGDNGKGGMATYFDATTDHLANNVATPKGSGRDHLSVPEFPQSPLAVCGSISREDCEE